MKKQILSFAVVMLIGFVGFAQSTTPASTTATTSNAEITFDVEIHDFGKIPYAGNGTYEFRFKNTGKEPLIISEAHGSCGCTVPTYPKNVPIMPGNVEFIKVTYDTKRAGSFTKTVTINSNAKTPSKVITIKGVVEAQKVEQAFPSDGGAREGAPLENK